MSISMYQASVPICIHMLKNLSAILKKAATYADAKKIDSAVLAGSRLYPDMFPLTRQVQIACDMSKGCGARLSGTEAPKFPDNETTIPELIHRIDKTVAFLKKLRPRQIDGTEQKTITLQFPQMTLEYPGMQYLLGFVLPNLYFHVTTAYNILRHNGLDIGKRDFLGGAPAQRKQKPAPRKVAKKKSK